MKNSRRALLIASLFFAFLACGPARSSYADHTLKSRIQQVDEHEGRGRFYRYRDWDDRPGYYYRRFGDRDWDRGWRRLDRDWDRGWRRHWDRD